MDLRAGALTMSYDTGFLRYIRLGEHEVLRMIYHALRDHNWDTMTGSIEDESITRDEQSFLIRYKWISREESFSFEWDVEIEGTSNSELNFSIVGHAGEDLMKNRTGFCILHPIEENMGRTCTIFMPSDEKIEGQFPTLISPHQPFLEISKMEWSIAGLGTAMLNFEGDIFEMEDQRNWCDNSFKTYCTPQRIPFPAQLRRGEEVSQKVTLTVELDAEPKQVSKEKTFQLSMLGGNLRKPAIGVGAPLDLVGLTERELRTVGKLGLNHYRIELDFSRSDWLELWALRSEEARHMNLGIELVLFFTTDFMREVEIIVPRLEALPAEVACSVLLLQKEYSSTPKVLLDSLVPILRNSTRPLLLGAGTDEFFTELNRERVATDVIDFVSYSQNPQCHAFDNPTMIENLLALPYAVESARAYFDDLPVHVSPLTLRPRSKKRSLIPKDADPRQIQLFGAGWTMGSLFNLSKAGTESVTMFESSGYKGLMSGAEVESAGDFAVRPFQTFPLYHVLGVFLFHKSCDWLALESSDSLAVEAIGFSSDEKYSILVTNYKSRPINVQVSSLGLPFRVSVLEESVLDEISDSENYFLKNLGAELFGADELSDFELASNAVAYFEFSKNKKN